MFSSRFLEKLGLAASAPGATGSAEGPSHEDELEAQRLVVSGRDLAVAGHYTAALVQFKEALKYDPECAEAYRALGLTYQEMHDLEKAEKALLTAIRIRPGYAEALNDLGILHNAKGNFLAAVKSYVQALRFQSDSSEIRNNLALAYFNIGSYSEALKAYKQTLSVNPQDARALYGLAHVYMDLNDKNAALEQHQLLLETGEIHMANELLDDIQRQSWDPIT